MVNIAICDDEEFYVRQIGEALSCLSKKYGGMVSIESFQLPEKFLKSADNIVYDYVFLGINPGVINGFDIAAKLLAVNHRIRIFFISDYEEYVFESFTFNTPKFIRKSKFKYDMDYSLGLLDRWISEKSSPYEFSCGKEKIKIDLNDIVCALSEKNYLMLNMADGKVYKIRMTIKGFSEILHSKNFVIANSGCIVNLRYVCDIRKYFFAMRDNREITISYKRYADLKKCYMDYKGNEGGKG